MLSIYIFKLMKILKTKLQSIKSQNLFSRQKKINGQLRIEHLNEEEKDAIISLCNRYSEIFDIDKNKLTFTNKIKHSVNTGETKPIFKAYRYPYVHKQKVKS